MAIIKHKGQRVGIFIDTQNLYHSAKNLYKSKVDFGNVVKEARRAPAHPRGRLRDPHRVRRGERLL
jgi:uncharacterized LabA/DUF88 family protein